MKQNECSRVVFLDFDGVIRVAPEGGWVGPDSAEFCQGRMRLLAGILKETGARVVVSSDWRNLENREEIESHLNPYLTPYLHEDWATPITGHRWQEVGSWLVDHPEVTSYAILEDFLPHFEGCPEPMAKRLVLCTNRFGLVPGIGLRVEELLAET